MQIKRLPIGGAYFLITLASSSSALQCAEHNMVRVHQTLPALSNELLNVTPVNTGIVPPRNVAGASQQVTTFADTLVKSYAAPLAVSTVAMYMKNPYVLLLVSEGIAVSYILLGQQIVPTQVTQSYLDTFNKSLLLSAATGATSALARTASTSLVRSAESGYVKPLVLGGALAGAATAYFSPALSDDQKAIAYAGLVATAMPVIEQMCASVVQSLTPVEQKDVAKKITQAKLGKERAHSGQTKERVANIAVALIALGGVMTTVQAYQEGTLSSETQVLAGVTLASAVTIARESVLYEYGYRATQKSIAAGSKIVTQVITQPVKQYGQQLIDGVFHAFGWV